MLREIIEKKIPLWHPPKSGHLVVVEANHERGNDIELLSETWQGAKRFDSLNDPVDTEEACDFPEHRQTIHVETNSGMTEKLRDVEKVSCAAAQIENALGTRQVEFKLANPPDVNSDPTIEIEIFRPVRARICYDVPPANLLEASRIDCLNDPLCLQLESVQA